MAAFRSLNSPEPFPAIVNRTAVTGGGRLVCVVDDNPWVLDSLSVLLGAHGFSVLTFGSGTEFLADKRRQSAGCVILDQHMPGMDGLATLAALRHGGFVGPAILATGRLDATLAERAAALGAPVTLEKPFATGRLVELIHTNLGSVK
jgi:two-component system CheB/CheR fusion protein